MKLPITKHKANKETLCVLVVCALIANLVGYSDARGCAAAREQKPEEIVLPAGTELAVVTTGDLFSNTVFDGDKIIFSVAHDVVVDHHVLIRKGAAAKGVVINATQSNEHGIPGRIIVRVDTATATDGQIVFIRGLLSKRGKNKYGKAIGLGVMLGPLGSGLARGKDAKIPAGTEIKAKTSEPRRIKISGS